MSGSSVTNPVGRAYLGDVFMRHPLTTQNQEELGIAAKADSILNRNLTALKRTPEGGGAPIAPVGFSLNEVRYGGFPAAENTAFQRGWRAYLNLGVPLIEEEGDIIQPPPDMLSKQTYINATDPIEITATDTVEFSISNTISWSLEGAVQLTFGARSSAALSDQEVHLRNPGHLRWVDRVVLPRTGGGPVDSPAGQCAAILPGHRMAARRACRQQQ
jgi:hypothetical protein